MCAKSMDHISSKKLYSILLVSSFFSGSLLYVSSLKFLIESLFYFIPKSFLLLDPALGVNDDQF